MAIGVILGGCGQSRERGTAPKTSVETKKGSVKVIDDHFIKTVERYSMYEESRKEEALKAFAELEKEYKSPNAKRVLETANRIWTTKAMQSGGMAKGRVRRFYFQKGRVSKEEKKFWELYGKAISIESEHPAEALKILKDIPKKGLPDYCAQILKQRIKEMESGKT